MNERIISNNALPIMIEGKEAPQGFEPMKYMHERSLLLFSNDREKYFSERIPP